MVVFEDFGDSALLFELWFWATVGAVRELRTIRSDIRFAINKEFQEAGIVIAFPQRDLHFKFDERSSFPISIKDSRQQQGKESQQKGEG